MKIENMNMEQFLRDEHYVLNIQKSKELTAKHPSIQRKHIKKPKKVEEALTDLEKNHNWSWYEEIKHRWKDCMDQPMTFYRGNEMSGTEVFEKADKLALALDANNITKGDEILACMANVPELLVLYLAASKHGIKVNLIGSGFDKQFLKEIVENSKKQIFIGTDDEYEKIVDVIKDSGFKRKILVSLTDSLKDGKDPYEKYDNDFYKFENQVPAFQQQDSEITAFKEFIKEGKNHFCVREEVEISDEFTITYTSGSTKIGWPKAIIHTQRPYISIGRFHDTDLSRMPAMRNMRGLAHIPSHSNTDFASSISDTLSQKCTVAFEPIYNEDFLAYSLIINEPGFVPATRSHLLKAVNQMEQDPKLEGKTLPFLVNIVAVGENISQNEVHYINKKFKKLEAGKDKLPKPLSPITLSVGGGNCEHGGLWFTLLKETRERISLRKSSRKDYGLTPFQLTEMAVLREDGTECDYEEYGNLVANSNCTMKKYKDNPEETEAFYITDAYGRTWGNCNVWAYIGQNGNIIMKGRKDDDISLESGKKIPTFLIADTILTDEKNILSCEVVKVEDEENQEVAVAHIGIQPDTNTSLMEILVNAEKTCQKTFSEELASRIIYKIRPHQKGFPLTKSGKRNVRALEIEGIDDQCLKPIIDGENTTIIEATKYLENTVPKKSKKVFTK